MNEQHPPPEVRYSLIQEMFLGKRGRFRTYIFEICTGIAYPLLAIGYFIDPEKASRHSVIGQRVYPFDYLWNSGYILGGLAIILGVLYPRPRLRIFGLVILGTALLMQSIAAISTVVDVRESFNLTFMLACFARAYLVYKVLLMFGNYGGESGELQAPNA